MPNNSAVPPTVPRSPRIRKIHGLTLVDDYAWMRDADDPRLLAYLRAERAHYDGATEHLSDLRETLSAEMGGRLVPTDDSVRWRRGDQFYYMRTVTGSEYAQFMSSRDRSGAGRVLLDDADLCREPGGYVEIGTRSVSPDNRWLAYGFDTDGNEIFTLRFREIATGTDLPDIVSRSGEDGAWSADGEWFFYTVPDEAWRKFQVWRHRPGTHSDHDVLVFQEDDVRFDVTVRESTSGGLVLVETVSTNTTETRFVPADRPDAEPRVVRPRETGVRYGVDHLRAADADGPGGLVIVTNLDAPESRLMTASLDTPDQWRELRPSRAGERLRSCHATAAHLVLELRREGFPRLRIMDRTGGAERELDAGIPAGRIGLMPHLEYDATAVTVEVDSIIEPPAWYDVDLASGARTLVKRLEVPGHDPSHYRTERRHAPAADGTLVPVTLARRVDVALDGTAPALMWGYGAYESCADPEWDPAVISALDRGVVYALTHPRGGGENGRQWWVDGHLAAKKNTFGDHVAVADWLADGVVDPDRIVTRGLSAGGLLQGAALNLAPRRFRAVVAEVPFVDVINSMLDPTIPLTAGEWDEWGDPRRPEDFAWMYAYSPYDNLPPSPRPRMLVTGAVHDTRVLVHEPAKWVAKLRATAAPDDGELLFRVETGAGAHSGPTGRYAHLRYEAEVYAFVLAVLGAAGA
jgi:oligopeptidase B